MKSAIFSFYGENVKPKVNRLVLLSCKICLIISTFVLLLACETLVAKTLLKPGRYAGYLHPKHAKMKIPFVLDTVHIPSAYGQEPKLAAYAKLTFGAFNSHEYITYFFLVDDYDWSSEEMVLDSVAAGLNRDMTFNATIDEDGHRLRGKVSSERGGINDAEAELLYLSPTVQDSGPTSGTKYINEKIYRIFSHLPTYPMLTGSYLCPTCYPFRMIQLELSKLEDLTPLSMASMRGYVTRGRIIGEPRLFQKEDEIIRTIATGDDFEYNFFKGVLSFPRSRLGVCQKTSSSIVCGASEFRLIDQEDQFQDLLIKNDCSRTILPVQKSKTDPDPLIGPLTLTTDLANAHYTGYLHFEDLNIRRPFTLDVNVAGRPLEGDPTIAERVLTFTPKIHLQNPNDPNTWQRYTKLVIDPYLSIPDTYPLVFAGTEGDLLHITGWTRKLVTGIVYSATYGRIGTFELIRDHAPQLELEFAVAGSYLGPPQFLFGNKVDWVQAVINFNWTTTAPLATAPHALTGSHTVLWNGYNPILEGHVLDYSSLRNIRFDIFTNVFGADAGLPNHETSHLGKFEKDQVIMSTSSNVIGATPGYLPHQTVTLTKSEKYAKPELPKERDLELGLLHVFLPHDAEIRINGKEYNSTPWQIHRKFQLPELISGSRRVTLVVDVLLKTGVSMSKKISFDAGSVKRKPLLLDFF